MQFRINALHWAYVGVEIEIENRTYSFRASTVFNDPLFDLLALAMWCVDPEHPLPPVAPDVNPPYVDGETRGVHFWLQPNWHTFLVCPIADSYDVRCTFYENHTGGLYVEDSDLRTCERAFFGRLPATDLAKMIHSSIVDAIECPRSPNDKDEWKRPFAYGLLTQLSDLLKWV